MGNRYFVILGILFFLLIFLSVDIWGIRNKQRRVRYITGVINAWLLLIIFIAMTVWHFYTNKSIAPFIVPICLISTVIIKCGLYPKFRRKS